MAATPKAAPLGTLIDKLNVVREKKRKLAETEKELSAEYTAIEEQIVGRLKAEGMDRGAGKTASVSMKEVVVATVTDWDKVYELIHKNKAYHLLHRRVSDPAFRELYELEVEKLSKKKGFNPETLDPETVLPGFKPFMKSNLNLRAL